jgi:outer membrane protein assembly factor BamB
MQGLRKVVLTFGAAAVALSFQPAGAAPGDWPQWRGPNRNGISPETGLLKDWPQGGPRLVWKATGIGNGYSTVSAVGQRLYTTGDRGDANFVLAIDASNGKHVWAAKLGKSGAPGWGGFAGPRATPTVAGDHLYAVDQWGDLVCLAVADGKEIWRKNFTQDFGASRPEWGFSESPLVDGDHVIVTPGGPKGTIVALNGSSGALVWQTKDFTDPAHYSSINIADIAGTRQYVQLTAENLVGVSPKEGKILWKTKRKGETAVIPDPVVYNDCVYVTSGYGIGCQLFKVSASGGQFAVEQVYANKLIVNHHGGVVRIGDFIYGHSDTKGWVCQDFKTGESKWAEKKLGKGSILAADGMLYLRQEDKQGTIVLIEASPDGWKEHGRFDQPDRSGKNSWPHLVIAHGNLYVRDQDVLLCYDVKGK